MQKTPMILAALVLVLTVQTVAQPAWTEHVSAAAEAQTAEPGDHTYIVEFTGPARQHQGLAKSLQCEETYLSKHSSFGAVFCSGAAARALAGHPNVARLDVDRVHPVTLGNSVPKIDGDEAIAKHGFNGSGILVSIIDSGLNNSHPALDGRIEAEKNFQDFENDTLDHGNHGTGVASVVVSQNATRTGVAPGAKVLNAKACGIFNTNGNVGCPNSAIMPAVDWSIAQGANVIQMSLGGLVECNQSPLALFVNDTIRSTGVPFVISAGNHGPFYDTISSPSCAQNAIAVGATEGDGIADFSSRGERNSTRKPDLVAPGVDITWASGTGEWTTVEGTSASAPHVSGVVALMLEARGYNYTELKSILYGTAEDLGFNWSKQGAGRVNASKAVEEAKTWVNWSSSVDFPDPASKGVEFNVNYTGDHIGTIPATSTTVELSGFGGPLKLVSGPALQSFGEVENGTAVTPSWVLQTNKKSTWELTVELLSDQKNDTVKFNVTVN